MAAPQQQIPHADIISNIFKRLDVPEILPMRSVCKDFNSMIAEDRDFITFYNLYDRHCPWAFSYSTVDQEDVGYIYGVRTSDGKRMSIGQFEGGSRWYLFDMSESYMLLYDRRNRLVVVNVVTKIVDSVVVPGDEHAFSGEYEIKITMEEAGYKIIYVRIDQDGIPLYFVYHSSHPVWVQPVLDCVDRNTAEVDNRRNIILYDDEKDLLYTIFYREGDNNVPVYKITVFGDIILDPHDEEEEEEEEEEGVMIFPDWYFCGRLTLFVGSFETKYAGQIFETVRNMEIYERQDNGNRYAWLGKVAAHIDLPMLTDIESVSLKEVDGVLNIAFQINNPVVDEANTYIYRYDVQNNNWLERIEFRPIHGNRHSKAVFTSRLTLPLP